MEGQPKIYTYWRCRRCNGLICIPMEKNSRKHLDAKADKAKFYVTEDEHPECKLLYPEHFKTTVDYVFESEDEPDDKLAGELGYLNKIDFTIYYDSLEEGH